MRIASGSDLLGPLQDRKARELEIKTEVMSPMESLVSATKTNAELFGMQEDLGTVERGKLADLLVVDTLRPHLVPAGRFLSAWIHNGQGSDIESVMIDGEFVMRSNKVLTMDEAAVIREADAVSKRIWNKVGPVSVPRLPRPK